MQELETLLNTLIEKGWKPRGIEWVDIDFFNLDMKRKIIHIWYMDYSNPEKEIYDQEFKAFRELVNTESGLWQFVCENELVPYKTSGQIIKRYVNGTVGRYSWNILEGNVISSDLDYQYRLLESALIPEEELGKFLIENIVMEWLKSEQSKK